MLFAPKFDDFGCDVARAFLARCGGGRVHGLCTGSPEVHEHVSAELGKFGGRFWRLEEEEETWLSTPASAGDLEQLERELGPGGFGRIVTADRRVGSGFVRGGLTRPDRIGRLAARDSRTSAQRYVTGLSRFLNAVLNDTQPDIVFYYAVIDAPAVAMAELCKARGIPFCKLTHTRLGDRYIVDPDMAGRQANVAHLFERARETGILYPPAVMKEARNYLETFRKRPTPPGYSRWSGMLGQPASVAGRAEEAFRFVVLSIFIHSLRQILRGQWPGDPVLRQFFKIRIACRRHWIGHRYFSSPADLPKEFIYFPLHVNPEASTSVLSPWHTDQLAVIEGLAKAAPAHMQVVVKEHSPMLGRRPQGFYRQIAKMPRVILLKPDLSSFDLIRKAQLTAVITGTAAWEAICLKKRALIIGDSPFLVIAEGIVYEPDLTRLPEAIRTALTLPPSTDDILTLYIATVLSESFRTSSSLLWGRYGAHSSEERQAASGAIAAAVMKVYGRATRKVHSLSERS